MKLLLTVIATLLVTINAFGDGTAAAPTLGWHHESQLGSSIVSGNSNSTTLNAMEITGYSWEKNLLKLSARYLSTTSNGVESAKNWSAALRYERTLSEVFNGFTGYSLDSDIYAGYVQRNNYDLGVAYFINKTDNTKWSVEGGYRYYYTHYVAPAPDITTNAVRLYTEIIQNITKTSSVRLWIEFVHSVTDDEDYLVNAEPSLSVMMNDILSLKVAYLIKYNNIIPSTLSTRLDTIFTTALVAKF